MNIKKAVQQHIEMENFFSGGSFIKGKTEAAELMVSAQVVSIVEPAEPHQAAVAKTKKTNVDIENAKTELEKIAEEVRHCRKCEIGSTRLNAVPGEGNPAARIMFIGEAPGADEDAQGRPFVGRAGQLLDRIIAAMGLKREDVFIGNILKCRPPENRTPKAEEIINCLPFLQRQIETIKPDIIVALGAYAAQTLLETTKSIGQMRGHFFDYYPGLGKPPIKLLATFHTAYLLRNYTVESRQKVWEDMKKVLAALDLPVPK